MRILLDTHAFLWFVSNEAEMSTRSLKIIEDPSVDVLVSVATLWEIAIKSSIGKLDLKQTFDEIIPRELTNNRFQLWAIDIAALSLVSTLPLYHRDPFDRLLIAQAIAEGIPIVTRDSAFSSYPVQIIW
ncbi:MAG: type II toxin-antitoxin system VapC family toxin [Caldilineaceae bacterium]|nr:type II toxin-antitoxin system VapC family toxin [Caldilineaceae bacterium]HRJ40646.1 type II toxin-antitoxin system VapC family toxin [Caldilineaceae bacterium]